MTLEDGARMVIETCMNVTEDDRLVIVCDGGSEDIGMALREAGRKRTTQVRFFNLDIYGSRPMEALPETILKAAKDATVTLWTAAGYEGELETIRWPFIKSALVGGRHGHLINVTEEVFSKGMSADYDEVKRFTHDIADMLRGAREVKVTNPQGTDVLFTFSDSIKWIASDGMNHSPGVWLNLPDGEVFTTPESVHGKMVVDGVIGDYLGKKYHHKDLLKTPLTVELDTSDRPMVVSVSSENKDLQKDVEEYLDRHRCSRFVGEFSLGTNIFLDGLIDNMLLDEKVPGVHISVGDPMPDMTGASWTCPEKMALILTKCNVWIDGEKVMEEGEYIVGESP